MFVPKLPTAGQPLVLLVVRMGHSLLLHTLENRMVSGAQNSGLSVMHEQTKHSVILIIILRLTSAPGLHVYN